MFKNVGGKIKGLGAVVFAFATVVSVILGLFLIKYLPDELAFLGLIVLFGGPLIAWINSLFVYGFGELIEKTNEIERNIRNKAVSAEINTVEDYKRVSKLDNLRARGIITNEEYEKINRLDKLHAQGEISDETYRAAVSILGNTQR